jgi:hypothetical protein
MLSRHRLPPILHLLLAWCIYGQIIAKVDLADLTVFLCIQQLCAPHQRLDLLGQLNRGQLLLFEKASPMQKSCGLK